MLFKKFLLIYTETLLTLLLTLSIQLLENTAKNGMNTSDYESISVNHSSPGHASPKLPSPSLSHNTGRVTPSSVTLEGEGHNGGGMRSRSTSAQRSRSNSVKSLSSSYQVRVFVDNSSARFRVNSTILHLFEKI